VFKYNFSKAGAVCSIGIAGKNPVSVLPGPSVHQAISILSLARDNSSLSTLKDSELSAEGGLNLQFQ
jgi:hypothetical protein